MHNFAWLSFKLRWSIATLALCAALFACAGVIASAEAPWASKPFDQWTAKDVAEIFQASPWARTNIEISDASHRPDMAAVTDQSTLAAAGDETGATLSAPPEYIANAMLGGNGTNYNVYWLSSRTMRAALARAEVLSGKITPAVAQKAVAHESDEYQVLVTGPQLGMLHRRSPADLRKLAYLQAGKKGAKTFPTRINFLSSAGGVVFYFPKQNADGSPTIPSGVSNVDFRLTLERAMLYTSFNPQKMIDHDGADI